MKRFSLVLLACALAIPAFAQDGKTTVQPDLKAIGAVGASNTLPPKIQTPGLDYNDVRTDGIRTMYLTASEISNYLKAPEIQTPQTPGLDFPVSAGVAFPPFVLTNGYLYQPSNQTDVVTGGRAFYYFTITNAGTCVIHAVVKAPAEESNSFYLNIDAPPEDPAMIWDIEVTTEFADRVVSWRGDGTDSSDEFVPKKFNLTAGKHKLFIYGREPDVQLKTLSIRPAPAN